MREINIQFEGISAIAKAQKDADDEKDKRDKKKAEEEGLKNLEKQKKK